MRRDDPSGDIVWFLRSRRIVRRDDGWYVKTYHGDVGPFPDRRWAATELMKRYIGEPNPS